MGIIHDEKAKAMTAGDISQLMIAAGQLIVALIALAGYVQSRRNTKKIESVHIAINSRMDQLLEQKGLASEAKGAAEERAASYRE